MKHGFKRSDLGLKGAQYSEVGHQCALDMGRQLHGTDGGGIKTSDLVGIEAQVDLPGQNVLDTATGAVPNATARQLSSRPGIAAPRDRCKCSSTAYWSASPACLMVDALR